MNIAKGCFRFATLMYLQQSLAHIDTLPQSHFDATRIWLDLILKTQIKQLVDWNLVDKDDYLSAMQRSVVKDIESKVLLKQALTNQIIDRALLMKGIDLSYYYEGYSEFKIDDL